MIERVGSCFYPDDVSVTSLTWRAGARCTTCVTGATSSPSCVPMARSVRSKDKGLANLLIAGHHCQVYDQGQFTCSSWRKVDCSVQGLQLSNQLIQDFVVERKFVTENLDSTNPEEDLPWRNRNT